MKSAILLEAGDISFSRVVVAKTFSWRGGSSHAFQRTSLP
jgi:hypothetical protein